MYIFLNNTGNLRAGWRILSFMAIFLAITATVMITVRTILGSLKKGSDLQFMLLALAATVAVVLARKFIDKKSFSSLGLKWDKFAMLDIFSGILNSALVMAGTYFILLYTHLIEFNGFTWWMDAETSSASFQLFAIPVVLVVLFKLTLVAWWEELVFRGYLFQNLIDGIGLKWSIVLSSIVFGFGHFFNPNATLLSTLMIALITPQLIYAYLKTGRLWLPIGLHLGWNFFQSAVFGFAASGQHSPSLIAITPGTPDWLSGGPFGAEGSLVIMPFTMLSFILIHYWVSNTRHPGQKVFQSVL